MQTLCLYGLWEVSSLAQDLVQGSQFQMLGVSKTPIGAALIFISLTSNLLRIQLILVFIRSVIDTK